MGLFKQADEKHYIVIDAYTKDVLATCTTKETKQISQVTATARFVECSEFELYKAREHNKYPDDLHTRKLMNAKDLK